MQSEWMDEIKSTVASGCQAEHVGDADFHGADQGGQSGSSRPPKNHRRTTNFVGQMTNLVGQSPFSRLFSSDTLVALLKIFLLRPEEAFYQRELADATRARLYLVQRELARLERAGLVLKMPSGNRVYYRANRSHPALEDLKRAFLKTVALGDALRVALAPVADQVRVAFIYGSYASGQETAGSDIDLLLVGNLSAREAAAVLGPSGRELGREFNPTIYPPEEFRNKARAGHHFVKEVLKNPKVFLIGDDDALARLVG